jgi:hypothetical protein
MQSSLPLRQRWSVSLVTLYLTRLLCGPLYLFALTLLSTILVVSSATAAGLVRPTPVLLVRLMAALLAAMVPLVGAMSVVLVLRLHPLVTSPLLVLTLL